MPAQPFAARGVYRGDPIAADQLPAYLAKAVVAIEDRRFYSITGSIRTASLRAALHNCRARSVEGGSTITQQLARLTYLSPERSLRRKVQEAMLALWLEARLSKDEILARYLNSVYFGAGAYGADAAAKRYFGKKAGDLDLAEVGDAGRADPRPVAAGAEPQPEGGAPPRASSCSRRWSQTGAIDEAARRGARRAGRGSRSRPNRSPTTTISSTPPRPR